MEVNINNGTGNRSAQKRQPNKMQGSGKQALQGAGSQKKRNN